MQIVPSTGRRLARSLGIRKFTTGKLTDPETNVKLGTLLLQGSGQPVRRRALRARQLQRRREPRRALDRRARAVPQDEFIDDIPFPETQIYVKKILGTAEDYRQLYGDRADAANCPRRALARRQALQPALGFRQRLVLLAEAEADVVACRPIACVRSR